MPDLQSKCQLPQESFPVFVSFPKFALKLLFSCSYRLVMRRELEGGVEGERRDEGRVISCFPWTVCIVFSF